MSNTVDEFKIDLDAIGVAPTSSSLRVWVYALNNQSTRVMWGFEVSTGKNPVGEEGLLIGYEPIPEPGTAMLLGGGMLAGRIRRRRMRRKK